MSDSENAQLLVAHPGHELLLYGWIRRHRPVVQVLTDGSGHSSAPRLSGTTQILEELGAVQGTIFGRLSDRDAYAMILEGNVPLLMTMVTDLAMDLRTRRTTKILCDAAEGYNPVHDLCRLIAGAAIEIADAGVRLYEYAVIHGLESFDSADDVVRLHLDDATFAAKMDAARRFSAAIPDVDDLLSRHGQESYRHETFRRVTDWTVLGGGAEPEYERFGEKRVAGARYQRVIRKVEHLAPLRDALQAFVGKSRCVF